MGLHPCPFCLRLGGHALALCMYMQQTRKQTSRQAKEQIEGKHAKRQASKRCQTGANKHVKHKKGKQTCYQTKESVLGGQM